MVINYKVKYKRGNLSTLNNFKKCQQYSEHQQS